MPRHILSIHKVENLVNFYIDGASRNHAIVPGETSMFAQNRARRVSRRRKGGLCDLTDGAICFVNRIERGRRKNQLAKASRKAARRNHLLHKRMRLRQRAKGQR